MIHASRPCLLLMLASLLAPNGGTALAAEPKPAKAAKAADAQPAKAKAGFAKPAGDLGHWIWFGDGERCFLRRSFEVPVGRFDGAVLWVTCDNRWKVYVNGRQVSAGEEWNQPQRVDVASLLAPGVNVIAAEATNDGGAKGFWAHLDYSMRGQLTSIPTDTQWVGSTQAPADWLKPEMKGEPWAKARSVDRYGQGPWNDVLGGVVKGGGSAGSATSPDALDLLPGFKAELLHSVPKGEQGSWVNLCVDAKGRLIASNQNGLLYRITVDQPESGKVVVEPIEVYVTENGQRKGQPIGKAHGLLWAHDALYVVICDGGGVGNGLYRLRDTNGDDTLDHAQFLTPLQGGGEHGPHAIRQARDGSLWVLAGNHTNPPAGLTPDSPCKNAKEDHLLPRNPDGNGHATGRMAPGGWYCRIDPEGKTWRMHSAGFRNQFDFDWNHDGEAFTFDADMEWDTGTPWYRPTRINHMTSGAEFGWRYGTGKWPEYYPDSLGAVVNIGRGSPTGVTSGIGAKFPEKYQRALYALDWTYGKLYAIHLKPQGSSYTATFETFVSGRPLPLTDAVIGLDGAMYFTIGGRGTQSGLYRITYTGTEPTTLVNSENPAGKPERALRRSIEAFHGREDPAAVAAAWPHLGSPDRALRFAARVAIEWQAPASWLDRAFSETRPTALIQAMIAVARTNEPAHLPRALEALNRLRLTTLSEEQQLEALRAYGLLFIRLGRPADSLAQPVIAKVNPLFPAASESVSREAAQLLVYLREPSVVERAFKHIASRQTQEDQFYYVFILRHAEAGWTPALREKQFSWVNLAATKYAGGNSFRKFLEQVRRDTQTHLSEQEKAQLAEVIAGGKTVEVVRNVKPRQFVHNWQMSDLEPLLDQATSGRDFARGKSALEAAQCLQCHRFAGEGSSVGPDLTTLGNRFGPRDVLESILEPSKVVSDQYADTELHTLQGEVITGRIEKEDDTSITLRADVLAEQTVTVAKTDIATRGLSKLSKMPTGLIGVLERDEVLDLIAYLRSAGDANDKAFRK